MKEEKTILKVAVLSEPYFPMQRLSIKFNSIVLQHMEMDDLPAGSSESSLDMSTNRSKSLAQGQLFGIVQKMEKSYRSHAQYGTICEITAHDQTKTIVFNPYERPSNQTTTVQA